VKKQRNDFELHAQTVINLIVLFVFKSPSSSIGGLTVPFDILAEFLTTETRGWYLLFIKYFWTMGSMMVPIVAYYTLEVYYSWRLFAGLCIIPCLFSLLCGTLYVPESPRWLVSKGKKDEALAILRKAAEANGIDPYKAFPIGIQLADQLAEHADFSELFSVSSCQNECLSTPFRCIKFSHSINLSLLHVSQNGEALF
jgi:hypothetical protein